MPRLLSLARLVELAAIIVWAGTYLDTDTFGVAGTTAGASVLLVLTTEVAYRIVSRPERVR